MDHLLETLLHLFEIPNPVERDQCFAKRFVPVATPVFHQFFNIHLDYCFLRQDDWTPFISERMRNALDECLLAARYDQVQSLSQKCEPRHGIGKLMFEPLAAAIAQGIVRSSTCASYSTKDIRTHDEDQTDCKGGSDGVRNREYSLLELIEGPDLATDPGPFAEAIADWNPTGIEKPRLDTEQLDKANSEGARIVRYKLNWELLRSRLMHSLTKTASEGRTLDAGTATDVIDKALRKVLSVDRDKTHTIDYPYSYARTAVRSIIEDDRKKFGKVTSTSVDEGVSPGRSPPLSPENWVSFGELTKLVRNILGRYEEFTEQLLIAKFWEHFKPQGAAQKLFYLFGRIRPAKLISDDMEKARKRLEDDLRDLGY